MKNTKTIKTLLTLVAITVLTTIGLSEVDATNWNGYAWSITDVKYYCFVSGLTATSHVNACGDLNTSSNVWEVSGSLLTLTGVTSGSYNIPVYAWTSGVSGAGKTVTVFPNGYIESAYIAMNKNLSWEDSAADTSTSGYDWRSATGHEFGHAIGLAHNTSSSSVMYSPLDADTVRRSPTSHDEAHVSGNY